MDEGEPTMHGWAPREDPPSSDRAPLPRLRRVWPRILVRAAIGVVVLVALLLVAASTGVGLGLVVPYLLERTVPDGWAVDVGAVEGSWLDRVAISGLSLESPDVAIAAERLSLRYRLRPLLNRTVDIRELRLEQPTVLVAAADSAEAAPDGPAGPSLVAAVLAGEPIGGWSVRLESARIFDGTVGVSHGGGDRYSLTGLTLATRGALDERGLSAVLDTLRADFVSELRTSSDSTFRSSGRIALAGELDGGRFRLDTLQLTSDHSRVAGGGRVAFGTRPEVWEEADLRLVANPLDVRDLPFAPPQPLRDHPRTRLSVDATGRPDSVLLRIEGEGFAGRTSVAGRAVLRPDRARHETEADTPPALVASLSFDGLDLAPWSGRPFDGVASGELSLTLQRLGSGSAFSAEGVVRHQPGSVDAARLVSRPLQGTFDVAGRLPADSSASSAGRPLGADANLALAVGTGRRSLGTVSARVDGSVAEWRLAVGLDSARVAGSGTASWAGSALSGSVERLDVVALDLAEIDSVYPATDITGRVGGRIEGSSLETLTGRIDLTLARSTFADVSVDTLVIGSDVRSGRFEGTLLSRSDVGSVETRYSVELSDSTVLFDAEGLHFVRLDSVEGSPSAAELHGRVSGSWRLSEVRSGRLRAALDSARFRDRLARDVAVTASLNDERIVADVDLEVAHVLATPIRLRAHVDATGTTPETARGSARLSARRTHAADPEMVDSLRATIAAREAGRFELDGDLVVAEGGGATFGGSVDASREGLGFDVVVRGGFDGAPALLRGATIDSIFAEASGRRDSTEWRDMSAELTIRDARWRDIVASQVRTSVTYDSAGLRLDTLDFRSNVLAGHGSGVLPLGGREGRIDLTAEILDLDPLRTTAGRDVLGADAGALDATLNGSLDSLTWSSSLTLEALALDRIRMTGLSLTGEGVVMAPHDTLFGISSTELNLALDRIILPASEVRSIEVTAAGGPDSIRVEAEALVDERRRASALVHVDPRADRRSARIEDLRFQIDEDAWELAEEALVSYRTGVSVEPVLLRARDQELRLAGGISEDGALDLNARVDSLDVTTVADLVGFPRLRGWLTGRARVQGTTDAPEAWVDVGGAFHRANRPPGPVDIRIRANGRRVLGDVQLRDSGAGSFEVSGGALLPGVGAVPSPASSETGSAVGRATLADTTTLFGLSSDSIDVTVAADSFNLRWAEAFVPAEAVTLMGGRLEGSLALRGSSADPRLEGELAVRDGVARITPLGVGWDPFSLTLRGDGSSLVVRSARIATPSGVLTAEGTIGLVGTMPLDLVVEMDEFRAIRSNAYWAVVSGTVDVGGAVAVPELRGGVRVEALDVFLDEIVTSGGLESVELTERDLQMLRERFGVVPEQEGAERPIAERLTADLTVELGRDSWLRKRTSPEMAVPFSGTIEVVLRPGAEPDLQGSVDVIAERGFVEQFGRRFKLSEGTVTFGGPPTATQVDLRATYTIPSHDNPDGAEVVIILDVAGTRDDLGLTLSSEPQMENADIVSYIATGRPAAGSLALGGGQGADGGLVSAGAGYALGQMTALIETAAARSAGLDVIEIRREGLRQAILVAGKYVSPRLYVGFAQPLSFEEGEGLSSESQGRSELEIEFEALRWLLVNVEGSGSSVRFFLRGRRAY